MTRRLYWEDARLSFDAVAQEPGALDGRPTIVLDRTAFYPESGGQMADRGTLASEAGQARVVDVQVDEAGRVHHVVDGAAPAPGQDVRGVVDGARRREHMALHTGQHMLSRALVDVAGAETVSARLGESACTIDLGARVPEAEVARAEARVRALVDEDRAVRAWFPEPAELATLDLRRAPKVADGVRVVAVEGFDVTPCGGTHCASTAAVGLLRVTGVTGYKGGVRVTFAAGARARRDVIAETAVLAAMARDFTCGPTDVPAAVARLRADLGEAREALGRARARLADRLAEDLAGGARVVERFEDMPVELVRTLAGRLTGEADVVCLFAVDVDGGTHVLAARGGASTYDCGAFVRRVAEAAGGRGGGRPERAEGRLPAGADWAALVEAHADR